VDGLPTSGTVRSSVPRMRIFSATRSAQDFSNVFLALKRRECEKFGALVTDRDHEWYSQR